MVSDPTGLRGFLGLLLFPRPRFPIPLPFPSFPASGVSGFGRFGLLGHSTFPESVRVDSTRLSPTASSLALPVADHA